jgi:hypothetical protein
MDAAILIAFNLASLGFTLNGISTRIPALPFYDLANISSYQASEGFILVSSFMISIAIWKRDFFVLFYGLSTETAWLLNLFLNKATFEPVFLIVSQDAGLFNSVFRTLPLSFYSAPWYEMTDVLTFLCFLVATALLLVRLWFRFGFGKSILFTALIDSGLLSYFELVTMNGSFGANSVLIQNEGLTNFSTNWT